VFNDVLRAISRAGTPGLLAARTAETGTAQLIAESGAAPVEFEQAASGRLGVTFRAAAFPMPDECRAYVEAAARDCRWNARVEPDAIWLCAELGAGGTMADELSEFCGLARQIVEAAAWLTRDETARRVWAGSRSTHEKEETPNGRQTIRP
jgi:hypothetical protein